MSDTERHNRGMTDWITILVYENVSGCPAPSAAVRG